MSSYRKDRIFGLDLLRAIAISMVLFAHCINLFSPEWPRLYQFHLAVGSCGVDIFFALSGFLIGGILLRDLPAGPTTRAVLKFWARRWFRTLPNYYLWLLINLLVAAELYQHPLPLGRYYIFAQNLLAPSVTEFYSIAWSLAIEEWFYVILPVALISFFFLTRSWRLGSFLCIAVLGAASFGWRIHEAAQSDVVDWDVFRKITVLRFDSLMFGVAGAALKIFCARWWSGLRSFGTKLGGLLFLAYAAPFFWLDLDRSFGSRTFLLMLTPLATTLFLPSLERMAEPERWRDPIRKISDWSYSLYLVHATIYLLLIRVTDGVWMLTFVERLLFVAAWMILSFGLSALNFRRFEFPVRQLRELI